MGCIALRIEAAVWQVMIGCAAALDAKATEPSSFQTSLCIAST